eukprot:COSAG05_NODE_16887_length_336_cov_1.092827_1_plen_56_part_10
MQTMLLVFTMVLLLAAVGADNGPTLPGVQVFPDAFPDLNAFTRIPLLIHIPMRRSP